MPIKTKVSINAKPTSVLENNFSYSSGFLAVDIVKEPKIKPVEIAPMATGKLTRPYVRHFAAWIIN